MSQSVLIDGYTNPLGGVRVAKVPDVNHRVGLEGSSCDQLGRLDMTTVSDKVTNTPICNNQPSQGPKQRR